MCFTIYRLLIFLHISLLTAVQSLYVAAVNDRPQPDIFIREKMSEPEEVAPEDCAKVKDHKLVDIANKLCLNCHELLSHKEPNFHYECSKNCFSTPTFNSCLRTFSGTGIKTQKRNGHDGFDRVSLTLGQYLELINL